MKSPKPPTKSKPKPKPPQDEEATPQEKLDAAASDLQKWTAVAAKPGLSAAAATWAAQAARSAQAELQLRQKSASQPPEGPPPDDPNLATLLGMPPSPPDQSAS